jgi:hypothetical protein
MTDIRTATSVWEPRPLRTFFDSHETALREMPDGRWLDENEVTVATTGDGDWPMDTEGRPLDGVLTGRGLADWERKLIAGP